MQIMQLYLPLKNILNFHSTLFHFFRLSKQRFLVLKLFHQLPVPNFVLLATVDPRPSKRGFTIPTFNFRISFLKRFARVRITSASCFELVHYTNFIS